MVLAGGEYVSDHQSTVRPQDSHRFFNGHVPAGLLYIVNCHAGNDHSKARLVERERGHIGNGDMKQVVSQMAEAALAAQKICDGLDASIPDGTAPAWCVGRRC